MREQYHLKDIKLFQTDYKRRNQRMIQRLENIKEGNRVEHCSQDWQTVSRQYIKVNIPEHTT